MTSHLSATQAIRNGSFLFAPWPLSRLLQPPPSPLSTRPTSSFSCHRPWFFASRSSGHHAPQAIRSGSFLLASWPPSQLSSLLLARSLSCDLPSSNHPATARAHPMLPPSPETSRPPPVPSPSHS